MNPQHQVHLHSSSHCSQGCHSVGRMSEYPHRASESPTSSHALPSLADLQRSLAQALTLALEAVLTVAGARLEVPHMGARDYDSGIKRDKILYCNFDCSPTVASSRMMYIDLNTRSGSRRIKANRRRGKEVPADAERRPFARAAGVQSLRQMQTR